MTYTQTHLAEAGRILELIDTDVIEHMASILASVRDGHGRLFFLGVGGSAANCSHAVNDFRKIAGFEAYAPSDNVSELTARTNDEGWETVFVEWLKGSRLRGDDAVFVLSVGGGNLRTGIRANLVRALEYATEVGAYIVGIVGRDGGYTARVADACAIVPTVNAETVTPHSEAFQAVIWHLLVSHPTLKTRSTKWEAVEQAETEATASRVPAVSGTNPRTAPGTLQSSSSPARALGLAVRAAPTRRDRRAPRAKAQHI